MNSQHSYGKVTAIVYFASALLVAAVIGSMLYTSAAEPGVTVNEKNLKVSTLLYGVTQPLSEVTAVELKNDAPAVANKTNGIGLGSIDRGWFMVAGMGKGRLYVHMDSRPFVYITTRDSFIIINFKDGNKTQKLYDNLLKNWKH